MTSSASAHASRVSIVVGAFSVLGAFAVFGACSESPTSPQNPIPVVLSVSPTSVLVGTAATPITVTGEDFISSTRARINGSDRVTEVLSATQLTVLPLDSDFAALDTLDISAVNPVPGGGISGVAKVVVQYPALAISAMEPDSGYHGEPPAELVVTGEGFLASSVININNVNVATTFVSATELRTTATTSLTSAVGNRGVRVANPTQSRSSASVQFVTHYRAPVLSGVLADSLIRDVHPAVITVRGDNLYAASGITVNGAARATTFVNDSTLTATLQLADVSAAQTLSIRIVTPTPGGGTTAAWPLPVVPPAPSITSLSPAVIAAGASAFLLRVNGQDFPVNATATANGSPRTTTVVSSTALDVAIEAADVAVAGGLTIVVQAPSRGLASSPVGAAVLADSLFVGAPIVVDLPNQGIAADPVRPLLYASLGSTAAANPNSIVKIDVATGVVHSPLFIGSNPSTLAVSDDGQYLYVAQNGASSIVRVRLSDFVPDDTLTLTNPTFRTEDIVVLEGMPNVIAVSMVNSCCSPRHEGVRIFDNGTMRPVGTGNHTGANRIARGRFPTELFGYNNESTEFGLRRLNVAPDGIRQGLVVDIGAGFGTDIESGGGRIFSTNGGAYSPQTLTLLGSVPTAGLVEPDGSTGRVHYAWSDTLRTYSIASLAPIGLAVIPEMSGSSQLVRFGTNGLAFGRGPKVVLVAGTLIGN